MSTQTSSARSEAAARLRKVNWYQQPMVKRLFGMLVLALVVNAMTGEQGSSSDLFLSLKDGFPSTRMWIILAIAIAIWATREFAAEPVKSGSRSVRDLVTQAPAVVTVRERLQRDKWTRWGVLALVVVLALVIPGQLTGYWQTVLVDQIAIFVLLAIGLNVVIGWAGLLDLGFFAFFAVGAYSAAYWTGSLPVEPPIELNNFLVIPVAMVTCLIAGVLLGAPTLRLRGDYLAIVTLGFHEIVYIVAKNADNFTGGPQGVPQIPPFKAFGYEFPVDPMPYWYLLVALVVIIVFAFSRLEHSRVGRAWTAIREDEVAAAANGVDTIRFKLLAFAIGASSSGVAGVVYASKVGYFNPENFAILNSILVLAYVLFGGMGSIPGVLVGTAFLVWLPEILRDKVPPSDRYMYLGALLVVMMIFRPQGLWPSKRRQRELKQAEEGIGDADAMSEPAGGRI
ncbi:hypothetical protein SRB5_69550 [Streptomyces sp. RB5]|uniref:Branched-chain amino acid ABC transporter permease n=1 Tax=Streptomyces smaragdinus TaxID=2585196 RepID=A0A7K0CUV6_9ACTN|nr:branched-chain amino acid ABC transporter permease [Streptomyces smaragdinus]MQY16752.1 hypothetical protein [Streptomyces smaragdinus]